VLQDGHKGLLLLTCWGGCDRLDVLAELRRSDLLDGRADYTPRVVSPPRGSDDPSRTARALKIWRNTERGAGSIVERYLVNRGITLDRWPAALRYHPRCPRPSDDQGNFVVPFPAMVSLVEHVERGAVAVHCTYLRPDGGKAEIDKPKAIFGPVAGAAVRIDMPHVGQWFAVAEGIETALSVAVASSLPVWAALSAGGIKNLILPPEATHIVICADHDENGVGERAARDAATRWLAEGRRVRVAKPPELGSDFNDVLNRDAAMAINEARHVA
jgi:hypothetical protein